MSLATVLRSPEDLSFCIPALRSSISQNVVSCLANFQFRSCLIVPNSHREILCFVSVFLLSCPVLFGAAAQAAPAEKTAIGTKSLGAAAHTKTAEAAKPAKAAKDLPATGSKGAEKSAKPQRTASGGLGVATVAQDGRALAIGFKQVRRQIRNHSLHAFEAATRRHDVSLEPANEAIRLLHCGNLAQEIQFLSKEPRALTRCRFH